MLTGPLGGQAAAWEDGVGPAHGHSARASSAWEIHLLTHVPAGARMPLTKMALALLGLRGGLGNSSRGGVYVTNSQKYEGSGHPWPDAPLLCVELRSPK